MLSERCTDPPKTEQSCTNRCKKSSARDCIREGVTLSLNPPLRFHPRPESYLATTSKGPRMSKSTKQKACAAIHVGAPAKSFSATEGYEPERRGWDEKTYRLKNRDTNNHYDFSRKHLNFEINSEGKIAPLGSNPIPLHERLKHRLDELGFKPYKDKDNPLGNADNSPNCTVGIIVSGDHDVLTRLAFGEQDVDFTLHRSNANGRWTPTYGHVSVGEQRISLALMSIAMRPPRTFTSRPFLWRRPKQEVGHPSSMYIRITLPRCFPIRSGRNCLKKTVATS